MTFSTEYKKIYDTNIRKTIISRVKFIFQNNKSHVNLFLFLCAKSNMQNQILVHQILANANAFEQFGWNLNAGSFLSVKYMMNILFNAFN